jgi:hypothetical protein
MLDTGYSIEAGAVFLSSIEHPDIQYLFAIKKKLNVYV